MSKLIEVMEEQETIKENFRRAFSEVFSEEQIVKILFAFETTVGRFNVTYERLFDFATNFVSEEEIERAYQIARFDPYESDCIYEKFDSKELALIADSSNKIQKIFLTSSERITDVREFVSYVENHEYVEEIQDIPDGVVLKHPYDHDEALKQMYQIATTVIMKHHGRLPRKKMAQWLFGVGVTRYGEAFARIPIKHVIANVPEEEWLVSNFEFIAQEVIRDYVESLGIETIDTFYVFDDEVEEEDQIDFYCQNLEAVMELKTKNERKLCFYTRYSERNKDIVKQITNSSDFEKISRVQRRFVPEVIQLVTEGSTISESCKFVMEKHEQEKLTKETKLVEVVLGFEIKSNKKHVFSINTSNGHYDVRVLESTDPTQVMLGELTHCCQHLGGVGESCMITGIKETKSGFMVWEKNGEIKAQAWIWVDKEGGLVLDNIETANFIETKIVLSSLGVWAEEHDEFTKIQIGTGYNDLDLEGYKTVDEGEKFVPAFEYDGYTDAGSRVWFKKGGVVCDYDPALAKSNKSSQALEWDEED